MKIASKPLNEAERLRVLHSYRILDTEPEAGFDHLAEVAAYISGSPIALISLIDSDRQWFKAKIGMDVDETPRDVAFCSHAILTPRSPLVVNDTLRDPRFADHPLVLGDPKIRFYVGVPLTTADDQALGTLCVVDRAPKVLEPDALRSLEAIGEQVVSLLELRLVSARMAEALERVHAMREMLPICSYCKCVRDEDDDWQAVEGFLQKQMGAELSHGICPACLLEHHGISPSNGSTNR